MVLRWSMPVHPDLLASASFGTMNRDHGHGC
jgi:hypothetical protein